jgi:hypothetical protein
VIISPKFVALDRVWFLAFRSIVSAAVETVVLNPDGTSEYKLSGWPEWFKECSLYSTFSDVVKVWRNDETPNQSLDSDGKKQCG